MPLNVHFQVPHLSNSHQAKPTQTPQICPSTRILNDLPLHLLGNNKKGTNLLSKRSSSKNQLKSPRNHCFQTLQLRAMLRKAKEVSPNQTFLPPKSPRPLSGVTHKPQRTEIRRNSGSNCRLGPELNENLRQQVIKSNKCKKLPNESQPSKSQNNAQNCIVQLPAEEMGSLSQIIFFGGDEQVENLRIVLLKESISKGGQLECQELLQQLQDC